MSGIKLWFRQQSTATFLVSIANSSQIKMPKQPLMNFHKHLPTKWIMSQPLSQSSKSAASPKMHRKKLLMIGTRLSSVPFQEIRDLSRKKLKKSGLMKKVFGPRSGNLIQTKCLENALKRTGNAQRSWTWSRTNRTKIKSKKSCIKTTEPSNWHTNTLPPGVHLATFGQFPTMHGHNFVSRPK